MMEQEDTKPRLASTRAHNTVICFARRIKSVSRVCLGGWTLFYPDLQGQGEQLQIRSPRSHVVHWTFLDLCAEKTVKVTQYKRMVACTRGLLIRKHTHARTLAQHATFRSVLGCYYVTSTLCLRQLSASLSLYARVCV